jgi:hypothetical protein
MIMNSVGNNTDLVMTGGTDVTLDGTGILTMSNTMANRIYADTGERLINTVNHTIEGAGQIWAPVTNDGTMDANATSGLALTVYNKTNNGVMRASNGGRLNISVDIDGTGRWEADGGKIQLNSGVDVTTTGTISVTNGGELELNDANMTGSDLSMDSTGIMDINSVLSLSGNLSFEMTNESLWDWGTNADLLMSGGVGANIGEWGTWAAMEIGGSDYGTDPVNHVGAPGGFSSNFDLTELIIGEGASVYLTDTVDNGNRGGSHGDDEALYVDILRFADSSGLLNINGLHFYYKTLHGNIGQIIDLPIIGNNITGTVTLQSNTNHSALITFEVRQPGTTAIAANGVNDEDSVGAGTQITTGTDGGYTIIGVPAGTYDVTAKGSKWLRQKQADVVVTGGGPTVVDFANLKGGDTNNTNSVNIQDLNILKSTYGKSQGQTGYDDRADFNKSGSVNIQDLNTLKSNYGKSGAQ